MEWLCQRPETNKTPQNKLTLEEHSRSSRLASKVAEKTPPTHPDQGGHKEFSHHSRISWDLPWGGQASLGAEVRALSQALGGEPGCKLMRGDTGHLLNSSWCPDRQLWTSLIISVLRCGKSKPLCWGKEAMASRNGAKSPPFLCG